MSGEQTNKEALSTDPIRIFECNGCDWRGPLNETMHPKHDETLMVCPECHETVYEH